MTAIVDGGERARRTAAPRRAVARRAEGLRSSVKERKFVRTKMAIASRMKAVAMMLAVMERIGRRRARRSERYSSLPATNAMTARDISSTKRRGSVSSDGKRSSTNDPASAPATR